MKKRTVVILGLALAFALAAVPSMTFAKLDPKVRQYQKDVKKRNQEEQKKENEARRADPNRRLRPYRTLDELYAAMDDLVKNNPKLVSMEVYGKSVEGRDLRALKISSGGAGKPEMLFSANIHAQELAGAEFCMALLKKFAEGYGKDCNVTSLLDSVDVYVIPSINPDGDRKAGLTQARSGFTGFIRKNKNDIDLNRNFPFPADAPGRLNDSAGSTKKWMMSYRGKEPLSEPETKALIAFIEKHKFIISMNYHTTGGMIMYPPGTFPDKTPDSDLFEKIAKEYQALQFDKYKVRPEIDLYPTIGALDDYIYHRYGILAFTIEIGKDEFGRMMVAHNGSWSPVFWSYNVYALDQEIANLMPGALNTLDWTIKLNKQPGLIKWKPEKDIWKGEPEKGKPTS
jgi:predicted deacylase